MPSLLTGSDALTKAVLENDLKKLRVENGLNEDAMPCKPSPCRA